jgi:hypothetical protein
MAALAVALTPLMVNGMPKFAPKAIAPTELTTQSATTVAVTFMLPVAVPANAALAMNSNKTASPIVFFMLRLSCLVLVLSFSFGAPRRRCIGDAGGEAIPTTQASLLQRKLFAPL